MSINALVSFSPNSLFTPPISSDFTRHFICVNCSSGNRTPVIFILVQSCVFAGSSAYTVLNAVIYQSSVTSSTFGAILLTSIKKRTSVIGTSPAAYSSLCKITVAMPSFIPFIFNLSLPDGSISTTWLSKGKNSQMSSNEHGRAA